MAERLVRLLVDDLDGSEIRNGNGERVTFAVRGATYQIDLSSRNIEKLDQALKPFIEAAKKVRGEHVGSAVTARVSARAKRGKSRNSSSKARRSGKGRTTRMAKEELVTALAEIPH